jgi:hypothetical protein
MYNILINLQNCITDFLDCLFPKKKIINQPLIEFNEMEYHMIYDDKTLRV